MENQLEWLDSSSYRKENLPSQRPFPKDIPFVMHNENFQ